MAKDKESHIRGAGFVDSSKDELRVNQVFYSSSIYKWKIMSCLSGGNPSYPISERIYGFPQATEINKLGQQLWRPFYGATLPECSQVGTVGEMESDYNPYEAFHPYGMVRVLDISEILKFQASNMPDLKYSILVDWGNKEFTIHKSAAESTLEKTKETCKDLRCIQVKDGCVSIRPVDKEKRGVAISISDFEQLLFRKPYVDTLETDILGIPPFNSAIYLMLD